MDAALRWSPHATSDDPRFLIIDVISNRLRLCKPTRLSPRGSSYQVICTRDKLPNYTAFDWSKTSPNIVAVGGQAGEANIISIDPDQSNSNPIPSTSLSASGSQHQTQYIWSFPIKSQRKCNSIAFSTKNFLATGLERVRNDYSMNIYNVDAERSWKDNEAPLRHAYGETITSSTLR